MLVNDGPGTCGAAARLPNKPGIQKLTPPSSARAAGDHAAINKIPIAQPRLIRSHSASFVTRALAFAAIRAIPVPHNLRRERRVSPTLGLAGLDSTCGLRPKMSR